MYKYTGTLAWFTLEGVNYALGGPCTITRTPPQLPTHIPECTQEQYEYLYSLNFPNVVYDESIQLSTKKLDTGSSKGSKDPVKVSKEV